MNQEELNPFVYIQGVMDRGKEVIAELEKRGGINRVGYNGDAESYYHFINERGEIDIIDAKEADWLKLCYTEIKLPKQEYQPKDKELVWCWDDDSELGRCAKFYDGVGKRTFHAVDGTRNGSRFNHYAPYEGEYPEWAKEAIKKLEN